MDRIEKIINIDNSRSHRNGLLPFVQYGGDGKVKEVTAIDTNGNYGQYVCDFCIYSAGTNLEIARLKYLDVLRNYYESEEILRNAVYVKKTKSPVNLVSQIATTISENCRMSDTPTTNNHNTCVNSSSYSSGTSLKDEFEELSNKTRYEYIPLDASLFRRGKYGYVFEEPILPEENLTEEQEALVEKINDHKTKLNDTSKEFFVLLPDFNRFVELNVWWKDWWETNFKKNWEDDVFDDYEALTSSDFKFCEDVDRYILGQIEVVGSGITGSRVPTYVYYVNHFELKSWFENHSATTVAAYDDPTTENEWIRYAWEERGGGNFYDFLTGHTPSWQSYVAQPLVNEGETKYFKYAPPTIDLEVIVNSEEDYETLYNVYEYSVNNGRVEGVVKPYTVPQNGVGSALTTTWVECTSAYCESQLNTLIHPKALRLTNDICGIFEEFDTVSGYTGQLFECIYCTGYSETPLVDVYYSGINTTYIDEKEYVGETYFNTIMEVCPRPLTNAYQILDTTVIEERTGTYSAYTLVSGTKEKPLEERFYWSACTWNKYGWWECSKSNATDIICGDGENIKPYKNNGPKKYRNVLIVSCLPGMVGPPEAGDKYYVMARYDNGLIEPYDVKGTNGKIKSMKIPYKSGDTQNIVSYDDGTIVYDKILSTTDIEGANKMLIKYAKGITSGGTEQQSGIHYEETLYYDKGALIKIPIDGIYIAELYYDVLGDGSEKTSVYSEEYRHYRYVQRAKVTGMEVGTQWTSEGAVEAMLFTKDGYEGLQEEPKYDINLLYNRGNAAAWENHFKLSECNTMEDLENYGNNFFNL